MQQDWDESPPDDKPVETSDSADLGGSEAHTPPLDEPIAPEEDGNDTAGDDSAGMAVIRAIEESLARNEGESSAAADAENAAAPQPLSGDDVQAASAAESTGETAATLAAEAGPPLTAEAKARAAMGPPRPFQWSPFMQLVLGDTTVSNSMDQGYVERPWTSVNPPTTEAAVATPFVRPETGTGAAPAISVYVQVHLSDDAIRRVAETTVREAAAKSQHQIEIVAKRLHKLELDLIFQSMERRRLYR